MVGIFQFLILGYTDYIINNKQTINFQFLILGYMIRQEMFAQ